MKTAKPHVVMTSRPGFGREFYVEHRVNGKRIRTKAHSGWCRCRVKNCSHRGAAEQRLNELQVRVGKLADGTTAVPQILLVEAVAQYLAQCEAQGKTAKTVASYRLALRQFEMYCGANGIANLEQVKVGAVRTYREQYAAGCWQYNPRWRCKKGTKPEPRPRKPNSVNIALRNLSAFFSWAVRMELMVANPIMAHKRDLYMQPEKRENFVTMKEHQRLLAHLPPRHLDLYRVLWGTGMRLGELANLRVECIDLKAGFIHLRCRADWQPKWKVERSIPVSESIAPGVLAILRRCIGRRSSGYVFTRPNGEPMREDVIGKTLTRWFIRLRIRGQYPERGGVTAHILRHTYCSRILNQHHMPLTLAQACTGHRTLAMLQRYCHTTQADVAAFVATIG